MENTSYPIFLIFRLACLLLCALNYWHLTCGLGSYSLLPPINKEWGSISGLKCKSVWTMLHQFHPLRNADNFRTPRLILLQKHCSVICLTFAKALVLIHTGAKTWSQQAGEIVQVFLAEAQLNLCCSSAGVVQPHLPLHLQCCTSSCFQATTVSWMKKFHLQGVLAFGVVQFICAQQKHLHTWACNCTCEHLTVALLHVICKSYTLQATCWSPVSGHSSLLLTLSF